ncbi:MAG: hypothetical protein Alis3KO_03600 [Aliiglaciecola sp.]
MSLLSCLLDGDNIPPHKKKIDVLSPVSGNVQPLDAFSNLTLSQRIFGEGAAIEVSGFQVVAPFDCVVTEFPMTAAHIRLRDKHGLRLHIQCGVNAHRLYGEGFKRKVKVAQKVKQGQVLLEFDGRKLRQSLDDPKFAVTLLNSDKVQGILLNQRKVTALEDVLFSVIV